MKIKFSVGETVKLKDGEVGEVVSINIVADGVKYSVSSKEVDMQKKKVIHGIKTVSEDEIEGVVKE